MFVTKLMDCDEELRSIMSWAITSTKIYDNAGCKHLSQSKLGGLEFEVHVQYT